MKTLLDDRLQDCDVHDEVIFTSCSNDHLPNKAVSMSKVQSAGRILHSSGQQSTKSLGAGVLMKLYSPERKNMAGSVSEQRGECNAACVCWAGGEGWVGEWVGGEKGKERERVTFLTHRHYHGR